MPSTGNIVTVTASVPSTISGDYHPDHDSIRVRVIDGSVALAIRKDNNGSPGEAVEAVPAGEDVFLVVHVSHTVANKKVHFYQSEYDPETEDWGDRTELASPGIEPNDDGIVQYKTSKLNPTKYKFSVWYDANQDDAGGDPQNPDADETDEGQVTGTFDVTELVLDGEDKFGAVKEGNDRFVFALGTTIRARAVITPDNFTVRNAVRASFKWTLDPVTGVTGNNFIPDPDWGDHIHAKGIGDTTDYTSFLLRVLPLDNSGFGPHKASLEVVDRDITVSPVTARLFYKPTDKTHPGTGHGDTPNWYYYWSKEGNPAVCAYSRTPGDSNYVKWSHIYVDPITHKERPDVFGSEDPNSGQITFYDAVAEKNSWSYSFPEKADAPANWVRFKINTSNAPDFVNLTFAHEQMHKLLHAKPPGIDGDHVPALWEQQIPGMNANSDHSFGNIPAGYFTLSDRGAARDQEFYCAIGSAFHFGTATDPSTGKSLPVSAYLGGVGTVSAASANDWSVDGVNW